MILESYKIHYHKLGLIHFEKPADILLDLIYRGLCSLAKMSSGSEAKIIDNIPDIAIEKARKKLNEAILSGT